MHHMRAAIARLKGLFTRHDADDDVRAELEAHLEMETAEHIRRGMSPEAARRKAVVAAGGITQAREAVRDQRGLPWLESLGADMQYAVRALRRTPGFSVVVILTLALGIGANTAMFTLLRGTLLRPLPNRNGEQLVYLRQSAPGAKFQNVLFSVPEIADYRLASKTLSEIADYSNVLPFTFVDRDGIPVRVKAAVVSGNFFDVMGLRPASGRLLTPRDDGAAATPAAVLSYAFWMQHYGGDRGVVGRPVNVNGMAATIIGVLEPTPQYPAPTDIYVNTVTSPHHLSATMVTNRSHRMSEVFARLAPNASVDQARDELNRIATNVFRDHPEAYEKAAHYQIAIAPLKDAVNERSATMFSLLMGAAAFVLLIACANVANLTLMRGVGREREMQVRAALGAATSRLRRLLILENLVLALMGGVLGLLVALAALKLLVAFAAQFSPRADEIRIDGLVLAVGLITSVVAAVALSFVPRLGAEGHVSTSLLPSGHRSTMGRGRQRLQRSLVVVQVALCMVLLAGAGLLMRTLSALGSVDSGIHADHVLTMDLPIQGDLLKEIMKQPEYFTKYERIRDRVAALPGVKVAAMGTFAPLRQTIFEMELKAEGRSQSSNEPTPRAAVKTIDPHYFAASGIPLLGGRGVLDTDRFGTDRVVIVNRALARQLFGDQNPIGRRIAWTGEALKFSPFAGDWRTIVGIAGDTRDRGLDSDPVPTAYLPFAQEIIMNGALIVRSDSNPDYVKPAVLRAIHDMYPAQLVENVATMDQLRDTAIAPRRLNAMFIAAFGALAFVIAMVGIAGVLAFSVTSRTAEIGIRMSLGADAARVRRMVLAEGGSVLAIGLACGLTGALLATRLLGGLLFGVTPHDPVTLGIVAGGLAVVGLAACWLPAARAARVDPIVALRAD